MAQDLNPKCRSLTDTNRIICCWQAFLIICIFFVAIVIGAVIAIWLYTHDEDKFHDVMIVTDAALTQFDYINNNTLYYNLALNVTISNIVNSYDFVEAGASYQDVMFGSSILKTFNDSINEFNAVFKGHHDGLSLSTNQILKDNINGVYYINVNLCLRHRDYDSSSPIIRCDLHVRLKSHKEVNEFHATRCDYVGFPDDGICSIE